MKLEEAINHYLELKPCEKWIESIEPKFFFEFAETLIKYIKEESVPRAVIEEKIKELEEINFTVCFKGHVIGFLQEILNKGE